LRAEKEEAVKICTFNVNSIKIRTDLIIEWLTHRKDDTDILCFQEIKTIDEGFPFEAYQKKGFHCCVFGQKAYNGVAICSQYPMENVQKGFGDALWDQQKRIISAEIEGITIINLYAPHGGVRGDEKFVYKLNWYERLLSFLRQKHSPSDPLVIVGDMNVARENRDVYDPEALEDAIGTMPEERKSFENLLNWGLIDAFRHLQPEQKQFTWWDYIGGAVWRDEGMRIDYVLCTEPMLKNLKEVGVDIWPRKRRVPKPSDHAPLIACFGISSAPEI
jgi:exodeoxyribonuclease-3